MVQAATITVNSLSDAGTASTCTLRQAIEAANTDTAVGNCLAGSGADTIVFDPTLTASGPGVIALNPATLATGSFTTLLVITAPLTITGPTNNTLSVSAGGTRVTGQYRLLGVNDNVDNTLIDVSISNLTLRDARAVAQVSGATIRGAAGGCLLSFENLTLTDVKFDNCTSQGASDPANAASYSPGAGGALWVGAASATATARPSVTLTRVSAKNSQALRSLTPYTAPAAANAYISSGGCMALGGRIVDSVTLNDVFLENCEADNMGGLSVNNANAVSITTLRLLRNRAIGTTSADLNIDGGYVGGGRLSTGSTTAGTITATDVVVFGNDANSDRGGFEVRNVASFTGSDFFISDNDAARSMGGIEFRDVGSATLSDSVISRNTANSGSFGGLRARLGGATRTLNLERVAIVGNTSLGGGSGGAQFDTDGQYRLYNSTIAFNRVGSGFFGGGLQVNMHSAIVDGIKVAISNSTIARNEAQGSEALGAFTSASASPLTNGAISIVSSILGSRATGATQNTVGASAAEATKITYANTLVEGSNTGVLNQATVCVGSVICGVDAKLQAWIAPGERPFAISLVPMSGSKALNSGSNPLALTLDQRGLTRTNGAIDMGAAEAQTSELPALACSLDMDGDNQVTATKEGLVLTRAMLGFTAANAVAGSGITQAQWDTARNNLNANCGTNFAP